MVEPSNEKKPVQNVILIDTCEQKTGNSQETELQSKNEKKKNFFNKFTEKLKAAQSETLKNKMLAFIKEAQNGKFKNSELKQRVCEFINDFEIEFQNIWKEPLETEQENGEAVEGIITKALYSRLFSLYSQEKDRNLEKLFKIYDFIELKHLECKKDVIISSSFDHAIKHIHKVDEYKTPRDKLISLINCCKIVSSMVWESNKTSGKPTGADDFLPVLIFIVLKAQPKNPLSNIEFIRDFRLPHRLRGEEDYYFTAYDSALTFIEKLEPNHLKIDPRDFQQFSQQNARKLEENAAISEEKRPFLNETDPNESVFKPFKEFNNVGENAENSAKNPVLETEMTEFQQSQFANIRREVQELRDLFTVIDPKRLKFANKEFSQLNVCEIADFLNEYKLLLGFSGEMRRKVNDLWGFCEELEGISSKNKKKKGFFGIF